MSTSSASKRAIGFDSLGLEDALATIRQRRGAAAVCAVLALTTALAALFALRAGPEVRPLIPITATVWLLADLLTAFLLLAQFFVNGIPLFGILSSAYAFSGLLTMPYIAYFPGQFGTVALNPSDQQISISLWIVWHCTFPVLVICASLANSRSKRIVSRGDIRKLAVVFALAPLVAALAVASLVLSLRTALPHFILSGHFQPLWREAAVPVVAFLNALACATLVLRRQRLTTLLLWLSVATFAATLDALLNLSATRYSYAWDIGKLITVFTASVVLVMILCDIAQLYARLSRLARIDVLTSLRNRRALEEHLELVFNNARRVRGSVALLVVDIDLFKRYNDAYGHLAGDECLQRVAKELAKCATRPLDLVTRYGGEEFVIVLPDTPLHGALVTAEKVRAVVEDLAIGHADKALGHVTVSIGVGYSPNARDTDEKRLFEAADMALYEAKNRGRNRVVLGGTSEPVNEPAPYFAGIPATLSSATASARAE